MTSQCCDLFAALGFLRTLWSCASWNHRNRTTILEFCNISSSMFILSLAWNIPTMPSRAKPPNPRTKLFIVSSIWSSHLMCWLSPASIPLCYPFSIVSMMKFSTRSSFFHRAKLLSPWRTIFLAAFGWCCNASLKADFSRVICQGQSWPFIVDFPIKNGGSFNSYVKLPEG